MFESYGLAPKKLFEGKDFFIDEWSGKCVGELKDNKSAFILVSKSDKSRMIFDQLTPNSNKKDEELFG